MARLEQDPLKRLPRPALLFLAPLFLRPPAARPLASLSKELSNNNRCPTAHNGIGPWQLCRRLALFIKETPSGGSLPPDSRSLAHVPPVLPPPLCLFPPSSSFLLSPPSSFLCLLTPRGSQLEPVRSHILPGALNVGMQMRLWPSPGPWLHV